MIKEKIPNSYIDTDVIIRFLTGDDPKKQVRASKLFEKVEQGKLYLLAPDTVIADVVYVLSSPRLYNLPREEIRDILFTLLRHTNFKVDNKVSLFAALDIYASINLDFSDSFIAAECKHSKIKTLYSYDHDFDKIPNLIRREP